MTGDAAGDAFREHPSMHGLDAFYATHSSAECADTGRDLLSSADHSARAVGMHLLSRAARGEPPLHRALADAAVIAARDPSDDVRAAAAHAAGELPTTRSIDLLIGLVRDRSPEVRRAVAGSLALADDAEPPNPRVVGALLLLLADAAAVVRDMAAFALGTQLCVADSAAIRAALHRLIDEPDTDDAYPAAEAAMGLALRGDHSVARAIAERLRSGGAGQLWLDAAAALAAPDLLPVLCALREPGDDESDPWVQALHTAIAACESGTPPAAETVVRP